MGHARALLALTQRRQQIEVGALVAKKGLSVRETEALVRSMLARAIGRQRRRRNPRPSIRTCSACRTSLSEKLGAVVQIQHTRLGQGQGRRQLSLAR